MKIVEENLSVTHFQNGDPIPEATTEEEWVEMGEKQIPAFMRNEGDFHYNHYALSDERSLIPNGYRIPNKEDMNFIIENELYKDFPRCGYRSSQTGKIFILDGGSYWTEYGDSSLDDYYFGSSKMTQPWPRGREYNPYRALGFSIRLIEE